MFENENDEFKIKIGIIARARTHTNHLDENESHTRRTP